MRNGYFLEGKSISLSGLSEDDLLEDAPYYRWMNDLSLDFHSERSRFPNHPKRHRQYFNLSAETGSLVLMGIFDNESGRHIGNVSFKNLNWHSRRGLIGYIVGEEDFLGKGVATEAVGMFLLYGFQKLNLNRVHTTAALDNVGSIKVLERNGFQQEGTMRQHIINGDRKIDVGVFGTLVDDWMAEHAERVRRSFKSSPF